MGAATGGSRDPSTDPEHRAETARAMSDLDAPATKRDLLDFATKHDVQELRQELRHELDKLNIKIDAYWTASDRVQRLAFGMLATAVIAIIITAVTVILRG
jgi:hypothetical protein